MWIMLNPSTADAHKDDPTILRCIRYSKQWNFDELFVVNLFPLRASHPTDCRRWVTEDPEASSAIFNNVALIQDRARDALSIIAAWGAGSWYQAQAGVVELALKRYPLYCLGKTQSGAPKHPLARGKHRVPTNQLPILYRDKEPIEARI